MKKFLKSVLFIIIGILILGYFNSLYINTNYYESKDHTRKFREVPTDLEVINLGSSHGMYAFNYEDHDLAAANFGLYAQGFYYDYRILKQYAEHIKEGATVFIPISYFSFYQAYEGEKFDEFNRSYYRFLQPRYIKELKLEEYITQGIFPILSEGGNIRNVFEDIAYAKKEWETIEHNKFDKEGEVQEEAYKRASDHLENIIYPGEKNRIETIGELEKVIAFCLEKNYRPILVTTPFLEDYNKTFPKAFYETFYGMTDELLEKYPSLTYMDYSHDERFVHDSDVFVDADHMNLKGRKKFTDLILRDTGLIPIHDDNTSADEQK